MRTLRLTVGHGARDPIPIDREIVIGRESADVVLDDPEVSRRHTAVRPVEDGVEIEDLGSMNGTHLDGRRIEGKVTVASKAGLRVGACQFQLEVELPRAADEPIAPSSSVTVARETVGPPDMTVARQVPDLNETAAREVPGAEAGAPSPETSGTTAPDGDPELTVARPVPGRPDRGVPGDDAPPPGGPPAEGRQLQRPPTPLIVGLALVLLGAIAAVALLASGDDDVEQRDLRAALSASTVKANVLAGTTSGPPAGEGSTTIELDLGGRAPRAIRKPTQVAMKITSRYDAGSIRSEVRSRARPAGGGAVSYSGEGVIASGDGDFDGAKGTFKLTGRQAAGGRASFSLRGSIGY